MKSTRHRKILEIIQEYPIETQDELISKLREVGIAVTQATISRDIRDLKLVKIACDGGQNKYRYAVSTSDEARISAKYRNIIRETVVKVDYADNIVVLKTYPGMAQAAAAAIDGMNWGDIVGSIAGDDTIFVLVRERETALELADKFRSALRADVGDGRH
ncbi:MAG: arginine repressor [Clostridiales bacterium]|jgi:transcriptional regulator of arginine metabolism|nr:arginine repressor [Clostridiales bacterium]